MRITIEDIPEGYRWELHEDAALVYSGSAPDLKRIFTDILLTRHVLPESLADDPDTLLNIFPADL